MPYVSSSKVQYLVMKKFSIRELERFSGIKAHTLRTWEIRYGFLRPFRNISNTRYYDLDSLNEVLNLAILNLNGRKISQLASLSPAQIHDKLKQSRTADVRQAFAVKELLVEMYAINIEKFETVLDECFLSWDVNEVVQQVIFPFLKKASLLWVGQRSTEEHFAVTILRKKLLWATEKLGAAQKEQQSILLFLYDTKQLDLGLLYMNFHLRHTGFNVIYMGNDVSHQNLQTVFEKLKPDFVYTYLQQKNYSHINALSGLLKARLPEAKLLFTTSAGDEIAHALHNNSASMEYENVLDYFGRLH